MTRKHPGAGKNPGILDSGDSLSDSEAGNLSNDRGALTARAAADSRHDPPPHSSGLIESLFTATKVSKPTRAARIRVAKLLNRRDLREWRHGFRYCY